MATTSQVTNTAATSSNQIVSNPGATLDKDAFLKLLLIELQHQDPTDPMDSDKMLTQTSQLSALEMQQNTNTTMQQMVETMSQLSTVMVSNANMALLGAIGKMAVVDESSIPLSSDVNDGASFRMYLPKASTEAGITLSVLDSNGKVIREIKLSGTQSAGSHDYSWDGKDNDGNFAGAGNYTIKTSYKDVDGGTSTSVFGAYPIESVKFIDGVANAKLAGKYVTFDKITEITDSNFSGALANNSQSSDKKEESTDKKTT
ncbi:flagellar basal body rod modification protein [Campylobacter sp. MIT 99-7217]|uniref:flagellar basal body rod modification protein n=1 Tax=Campylobacter sp. MIT 99-7217 TaxID=535091 RepID=UPI00115A429E|nr:flagellar basal body rod modification protein [Campylobacter sp. MIT 99-7217]TQR31313.1 flagellar basal body rod modification protein [Campylobacter sp. MIT 99-7217]